MNCHLTCTLTCADVEDFAAEAGTHSAYVPRARCGHNGGSLEAGALARTSLAVLSVPRPRVLA